ncbi:MAG: inositol monophosphatase [Oligoflexales bacterium]|nr:inositol monophosphatase [Oligoflexales bacterium]
MNQDMTVFLDETLELAGKELMRFFEGSFEIQKKKDSSLVTDADLASERIIVERIKKYFPDDKILSEECGLSSSDRTEGSHIWIIDPLDGTTNFANRYPFFSVSIARGIFTDSGYIDIVLGGVEAPVFKKRYLSEKGRGVYCNGKPISCSKRESFRDAFIVTGFYPLTGREFTSNLKTFLAVAKRCQNIRRDGSAALDLALVAEGLFDGFWEYGLRPWDVAAGKLLVTESGGYIVNYNAKPGEPYDIEGKGLIAGSSMFVKNLSEIVRNGR